MAGAFFQAAFNVSQGLNAGRSGNARQLLTGGIFLALLASPATASPIMMAPPPPSPWPWPWPAPPATGNALARNSGDAVAGQPAPTLDARTRASASLLTRRAVVDLQAGDTTVDRIRAMLDATTPAAAPAPDREPLITRDIDDKILLVYPAASDTIRTTNLMLARDAETEAALTDLVGGNKLATLEAARGTPLMALSDVDSAGLTEGTTYTFLRIYRDTHRGETRIVLKAPDGTRRDVTPGDLADAFGVGSYKALYEAASGTAPEAPAPVPADQPAFAVGEASPTELTAWLRARTTPAVVYARTGEAYVIRAVSDEGVCVQTLQPPHALQDVPYATLRQDFTHLDTATHGEGTEFVVRHAENGLLPGTVYRLQGMRFASGEVTVAFENDAGRSTSLTLVQLAAAFGPEGVQNLATATLADPKVDAHGPVTYGSPPADARLFTREGTNVLQWRGGDCWFAAAADSQDIRSMIRPSSDGNPHHYDVRFFHPTLATLTPYQVTVSDRLAMRKLDSLPRDGEGHPLTGFALIEKGLVQLNNVYQFHSHKSDFRGIAGGWAVQGLQMIYGLPFDAFIINDQDDATLTDMLSAANHRVPVNLESAASNTPGAYQTEVPGILEQHVYRVLAFQAGSGSVEPRALLHNPAGSGWMPNGRGGLEAHGSGFFWLGLGDIRRAFLDIVLPLKSEPAPAPLAGA